jgi:hypothetical protein
LLSRFLNDYGNDSDREDWRYTNLEATIDPENLGE